VFLKERLMVKKRTYVKPAAAAIDTPAAELIFLEKMIQELKEHISTLPIKFV
jgi:hypothetical protein